ncbi:hypothetical protein Dimus_003738 [Dionaea muscipula]
MSKRDEELPGPPGVGYGCFQLLICRASLKISFLWTYRLSNSMLRCCHLRSSWFHWSNTEIDKDSLTEVAAVDFWLPSPFYWFAVDAYKVSIGVLFDDEVEDGDSDRFLWTQTGLIS